MRSDITIGSGNVFADIGHRNPEEALAKAQLISQISAAIRERGLSQVQAADLLEISRGKLAHLVRGQLAEFSLDQLQEYLRCLTAWESDYDDEPRTDGKSALDLFAESCRAADAERQRQP
jgi:predicted XRE-type DNA-binding protein